ncbi:MAG TPA: hypothetical protein VEC12_09260 [Bacteroidia bacterium]|nr:hypothetical protein [Bacteroidia bacterium]
MVNNWQWTYLEGLVPIIRRYDADRRKYKTLEDIMPPVVAYFDEKAKGCR